MQPIHVIQARANRWANAILYAELAKLSPEQLNQASAANFGSIIGIANHTVLADRAWLQRFTGVGEPLMNVDAVPWPEFARLRAEREAEDARVVAFAEAVLDDNNPARLSGTLRYTSTSGQSCAEPLAVCLAHFFNHQTFHRGQLHALLGVHGITCPNLDLIHYHVAHRDETA